MQKVNRRTLTWRFQIFKIYNVGWVKTDNRNPYRYPKANIFITPKPFPAQNLALTLNLPRSTEMEFEDI